MSYPNNTGPRRLRHHDIEAISTNTSGHGLPTTFEVAGTPDGKRWRHLLHKWAAFVEDRQTLAASGIGFTTTVRLKIQVGPALRGCRRASARRAGRPGTGPQTGKPGGRPEGLTPLGFSSVAVR